jgi:mannose-6-phosphate isomerase-like protein (cupin superfamily)
MDMRTTPLQKINLSEKFTQIDEHWRPSVVGELNGQVVKLVKFKGEFIWHQHEKEDELFMPVRGVMRIELRDHTVEIGPGEFFIVPRGIEHRPVADREVECLLFEPAATRNTGNIEHPIFTAP